MYDITALKRELAKRPESGMGYQLVEIQFEKSQGTDAGIAYNGELLVLSSEPVVKITRESFEGFVRRSPSATGQIKSLRVLQKSDAYQLDARARESLVLKAAAAKVGSGPAGARAPALPGRAGRACPRCGRYGSRPYAHRRGAVSAAGGRCVRRRRPSIRWPRVR